MTTSTARAGAVRPSALLGLVVLGGALGTAARAALVLPAEAEPAAIAVPTATFLVNAAGSLLLGVLVGAVGSGSPRLRAFLGTGVLGGFTTYSAFAVQIVGLADGDAPVALMVMVASLAFGVGAAALGLILGRRFGRTPLAAPEDAE